jgi:DNA polymerase-3 subunit alpha
MGKKKAEVMDQEKANFIAGAVGRGFKESHAAQIFDILVPFAGYGFNKSHAAAYSILAYQTAWLKANFPAEFMAANLTNEIASVDKLPKYIDEARKTGIPIDPPDINRSDRYFTVVDGRIVYGFLGLKGLGDASAEEIVARRKEGPYRNFMDFLDRVNIKTAGKKVIELLIQTGAFDRFGIPRATLAGNLERAVEYAQNKKDDKRFGQSSLFEDTGETEYPDFEFEKFPEWDRMEKLRIERELIGFYFSGHPMDEYRDLWKRVTALDLAHIEGSADQDYTLVGIIKTLRPLVTKKGDWMCFGSLGDYNGEIDLTFFPKTWEKCKDALAVDRITALRGRLDRSQDRRRERPGFVVDAILDLAELAENSYREVHIRLGGDLEREETLYPLRDYLFKNSGPCAVYIHVPVSGGETVIRTATQIGAGTGAACLDALSHCAAVAEVWRE